MKLRAAVPIVAPLCLLLTGCPLTDNYRLQDDALANAGAHQGGHSGAESAAGFGALAGLGWGGAGDANAGEFSDGGSGAVGGEGEAGNTNGGSSSRCTVTCNAPRECVDNVCVGGWVLMSAPLPQVVARSKAVAVAIGRSVFIWGGLNVDGVALNNGAIYDPTTDVWTYLPPDPGSPTARIMATAVWTGAASNKVIVFGGTDASGATIYKDGAVFDLVQNSWTALPSSSSISKRSAPYGYWDGTRAVFYGGLNATPAVVPGADRFDLGKWSTSTTSGDPGLLGFPATAFDGSVMYLQGGVIDGVRQDKVFTYTSNTDTWASLSKGPSARTGAFGAWDGTHFVVWGGQDDVGLLVDGKTLAGSTWSDMTETSVLTPRRIGFGRSGWAFQVKPGVVAIIGGQTSTSGSSDTLATDGASYVVQRKEWAEIPAWPSGEKHEYGVGVWTGEEFVVWGGRAQNVASLRGERWAP